LQPLSQAEAAAIADSIVAAFCAALPDLTAFMQPQA
jgi:hypothetical protein